MVCSGVSRQEEREMRAISTLRPDGSSHFRAVIRLQRPHPPARSPVQERGSQVQNGVETTSETSGFLRAMTGDACVGRTVFSLPVAPVKRHLAEPILVLRGHGRVG